jgi:hypothetical protein
LILNRIVKKTSNGLVLITTIFENGSGDCQQMRDIRNFGSFSKLLLVQIRGLQQGFFKVIGQNHF